MKQKKFRSNRARPTMGLPSWGEGTAQTPNESQKPQLRSVSGESDMTRPANREGVGSGMSSQSPLDPGPPRPSSPSNDFFSPRSTAAIALSSFAQRQQQQQRQLQYRSQDFSPPAAFDPPRATLRVAAKQRATEIQPNAAPAPPPPQVESVPQYLHGPPPALPPYYSIPYWQQPPQLHYPPPPQPPHANAWQPAYSSTSLLPDPRVSALSVPEDPYSHSKQTTSLSLPMGTSHHDGFPASSSKPLQPLVRQSNEIASDFCSSIVRLDEQ
jgi:hypothetical protein